jgi:competence protein ComEA
LFLVFIVLIGSGIYLSRPAAGGTATPASQVAQAAKTPTPASRSNLTATPKPNPAASEVIKVYITGEIKNPGVYTMRNGDRLEDLVNQAGGYTDQADQSVLDLAQRVKDEMHVVVPARPTPGATASAPAGGVTLPAGVSGQSNNSSAGKTKAAATPTRTPGKINVNLASAAELESLPGIGEVLAQRIIDYRTKNGPFKALEDLRKVQGITNATLEKIKDLVVFYPLATGQ